MNMNQGGYQLMPLIFQECILSTINGGVSCKHLFFFQIGSEMRREVATVGCVRTMHQVDRGSGPCIRLAGGSRPCIRLIGWGSGPLIRLSGGLDHASGLWVELLGSYIRLASLYTSLLVSYDTFSYFRGHTINFSI